MDKDKILGADDFVQSYKADNADAFVVENPDPNNGGTQPAGGEDTPHFVQPTAGQQGGNDPTGGFNFNFTGVRPKSTE